MVSGFVDANGARIAYDDAGSGDAVLLLHAGVADRSMWDPQWAALAERFRVIRVDMRGFGESTMPPGPFSYAEDALAVLDALGVMRAHVVGISMSVTPAFQLALTRPERVRSVTLIGGHYGRHEWHAEPAAVALDEEADAAHERSDADAAADADVRLWVVGPRRSAEDVDAAFLARARPMVEAAARRQKERASALPDLAVDWARAPTLEVPVLFVVGTEDVRNLVEGAREAAGRVPGARLVEIPDAAHLPNMERPDAFTRALLDFLSKGS